MVGCATSASSMYDWLKVLPAWRRYLAMARSTAISRAVSRAVRTSRLKPSFSDSPRQARANASWKVSRTSSSLQLRVRLVPETEVVDPDRLGAARADLVRPLVGDLDAHVLEQRQHVRQQDRLSRAQHLERELLGRRGEWQVEAHAEVARGVELLHPVDVQHGLACWEVVPVRTREGVAVALEERPRPVLSELLEERVVEVVRPRAGHCRQPRLELGDVDLGDARRPRRRSPRAGARGRTRRRGSCSRRSRRRMPPRAPPGSAADSRCRSGRAAGTRGRTRSGRTRPGGRTGAPAGALQGAGCRARSRRARPRRSGRARLADTSRGSRGAPCGRGCPRGTPARSTTRRAFRRRTGMSHGLALYAVWV